MFGYVSPAAVQNGDTWKKKIKWNKRGKTLFPFAVALDLDNLSITWYIKTTARRFRWFLLSSSSSCPFLSEGNRALNFNYRPCLVDGCVLIYHLVRSFKIHVTRVKEKENFQKRLGQSNALVVFAQKSHHHLLFSITRAKRNTNRKIAIDKRWIDDVIFVCVITVFLPVRSDNFI